MNYFIGDVSEVDNIKYYRGNFMKILCQKYVCINCRYETYAKLIKCPNCGNILIKKSVLVKKGS